MADIVILVTGIDCAESGDDVVYAGIARCTGMGAEDANIQWQATVDPGALASAINTAIKDAAIAAADDRNYTIGALDKKTLVAGAVGL